jgi:hypothetical protein
MQRFGAITLYIPIDRAWTSGKPPGQVPDDENLGMLYTVGHCGNPAAKSRKPRQSKGLGVPKRLFISR